MVKKFCIKISTIGLVLAVLCTCAACSGTAGTIGQAEEVAVRCGIYAAV